MRDGDKIKWVYLKENPLGLDGLGFFGYKTQKDINKFIQTYVDHNKIFERELRKKLQDFFDGNRLGRCNFRTKKRGKILFVLINFIYLYMINFNNLNF